SHATCRTRKKPNQPGHLNCRTKPKNVSQRLDLWDALPVIETLIYKHLMDEAPNKLMYVNSLNIN
ncbi:MAG TPA: hypothetical protein VGB67_11340, partial [Fibrella sp.]